MIIRLLKILGATISMYLFLERGNLLWYNLEVQNRTGLTIRGLSLYHQTEIK